MEISDVTAPMTEAAPDAVANSLREGSVARAIAVPGVAATYSRKTMTELDEFVARYQLGRLFTIKVTDEGNKASFGANVPDAIARIVEGTGAKKGDQVLVAVGPYKRVARALGELRNHLARQLDLIPRDTYAPLWVTDFPMFEYNEEADRWDAMHHMFTMPKREHLPFLTERPGDVRAQLYDVVLNGVELGSGSVRITDPELQQQVMAFVGYERERAERNFGFFLRSFEYGAPTQAGIALGLDNLVMTMLGLENLRDVIAFPNNTAGVFPLDDSPTMVEEEQLKETHLRVVKPA
jgi:aspartyl-tRNA synthetase